MPYEVPVFDLGMFTTQSDLSTKQFLAVKLGTTGFLEVCGAGEASIGILKDNNVGTVDVPVASQVAVLGVHPAMYGAAVSSYLQALTPNATGKLVPATTSDVIVAYALETGTVGDIMSVMILPRMAAGTLPSAGVGAVAYSTGSGWAGLAAGTAGQMLVAKGALAPAWGSAVGENTLTIPVHLPAVPTGDIVTNYTLGYVGTIKSIAAVTNIPVTTSGKGATIAIKIAGTATTGGVLTLSGTSAMGTVVAGTAITALNTFTAGQAISIAATGVTTYIEGSVTLLIRIQPTLGGV